MNTNRSLVALLALTLASFACGGETPQENTAATTPASQQQNAQPNLKPEPTPEIEAATRAIAALGPHTQATLPPVPFRGYAPPRPPEGVTAAYQFAAEHPEVLSYIPCFCGCQQAGHRGNHECFVRSRAVNGDIIEWDEHGVECAVCIDVATRSRQLHASGASVADIRAAIEREFGPQSPTMTPTPKPPAGHSH